MILDISANEEGLQHVINPYKRKGGDLAWITGAQYNVNPPLSKN